ncbi:hypothetical protein N9937_00205 [bacterium]|nr:hypothetical protein [bacterium]
MRKAQEFRVHEMKVQVAAKKQDKDAKKRHKNFREMRKNARGRSF